MRTPLAVLALLLATAPSVRAADPAFDPGRLHEVRLTMDPNDWKALRQNYRTNDYYAANIAIDGEVVLQVGIRSRGAGSRNEEKPGLKVRLAWPDKTGPGVHVNISGAGVTRHAKHPEEAQQLLEWLSSSTAQGLFAGLNLEFPTNPAVPADAKVAAWGSYKADPANVAEAGRLQKQAVMLMDRAGYR